MARGSRAVCVPTQVFSGRSAMTMNSCAIGAVVVGPTQRASSRQDRCRRKSNAAFVFRRCGVETVGFGCVRCEAVRQVVRPVAGRLPRPQRPPSSSVLPYGSGSFLSLPLRRPALPAQRDSGLPKGVGRSDVRRQRASALGAVGPFANLLDGWFGRLCFIVWHCLASQNDVPSSGES